MEGRRLVRIDPGATIGDQRAGDGLTGEFFEYMRAQTRLLLNASEREKMRLLSAQAASN